MPTLTTPHCHRQDNPAPTEHPTRSRMSRPRMRVLSCALLEHTPPLPQVKLRTLVPLPALLPLLALALVLVPALALVPALVEVVLKLVATVGTLARVRGLPPFPVLPPSLHRCHVHTNNNSRNRNEHLRRRRRHRGCRLRACGTRRRAPPRDNEVDGLDAVTLVLATAVWRALPKPSQGLGRDSDSNTHRNNRNSNSRNSNKNSILAKHQHLPLRKGCHKPGDHADANGVVVIDPDRRRRRSACRCRCLETSPRHPKFTQLRPVR